MRHKRKHKQRQQVRRILAEVKQELNDYRVDYEDIPYSHAASKLDQVVARVQPKPKSKEAY